MVRTEFGKLDRNLVTARYFDSDFDDYTQVRHWSDIPTPHLDSIMDYQEWDEDVKQWMYIMIGRMTFELNEAEGLADHPVLQGYRPKW